MQNYVEARATHDKKKAKDKALHHLELYKSEGRNAHSVEHHAHDGSIQEFQFEHPAQDEELLGHLAERLYTAGPVARLDLHEHHIGAANWDY